MKITLKTIENGLKKDASGAAYHATVEEIDKDILPLSALIAEAKKPDCPYLTAFGLLAEKLRLSEISEKQFKAFIRKACEAPELLSGVFASLPSVIQFLTEKAEYDETGVLPEHVKLWYKEDNGKFFTERKACTFLISKMTEEEIDIVSDAALKANKEVSDRFQTRKAKADRANALFD